MSAPAADRLQLALACGAYDINMGLIDGSVRPQAIDLFHTTADYSEEAIANLTSDARAANVRLHVLHDARDGQLNGDRIRAAIPDWKEASIILEHVGSAP